VTCTGRPAGERSSNVTGVPLMRGVSARPKSSCSLTAVTIEPSSR